MFFYLSQLSDNAIMITCRMITTPNEGGIMTAIIQKVNHVTFLSTNHNEEMITDRSDVFGFAACLGALRIG